jgi:hypothetical protein
VRPMSTPNSDAIQSFSTRTTLTLKNKSGAKGAAKNPVWQEEERLGMNPVPGNLQGKST